MTVSRLLAPDSTIPDRHARLRRVCNLYSHRKGPAAIIDLFRAMTSEVGNLEPADYYPDYLAPIVRHDGAGGLVLARARWGLTSSRKVILDNASKRADKLRAKGRTVDPDAFAEILRMEPDGGTTNVRNTASAHWKPHLGPASRCLVPFTAFSEPDRDAEGRYGRPGSPCLASPSLVSPACITRNGAASARSSRAGRPAICSAS